MTLPQVAKAYAVVYLGPGTFVTNGYSDSVPGGYQVKPGMKLIGSGIDVTKLVLAAVSPVSPAEFFAIGHPLPTVATEMVDLYQNTPKTLQNPQGCISSPGQLVRPGFPAWVVRDNLFRHTDGIPTDLTVGYFYGLSAAIRMTGLNGGVVQSNLIDLESPYQLQYLRTVPPPPNNPSSMSNTTMSGNLLRGDNFPSGGNAPESLFEELATRIEDSLFFSL